MDKSPGTDPFIAELSERFEAVVAQGREIGRGLGARGLNWRPPEGGWTVGQCLEHLAITADVYYNRLRGAVEAAGRKRPHRWSRAKRFRPSLLGRILANTLGRGANRRIKAPSGFEPPETIRDNIVHDFERCHLLLAGLLRGTDGAVLANAKVASPVSRWLRLTAGDAFMLIVAHAERHLEQARRIKERQCS